MSFSLRGLLSDMAFYLGKASGRPRLGVRILMYHRVTDAHPRNRLCVPIAKFDAQMRWLRNQEFQSVGLGQLVRWASGQGGLPPKAVVITFDDGFEDNFLFAAPALERYAHTGCFFVPSGFVESAASRQYPPEDRPMGWKQLESLLAQGHEIGAHSVTHRKLAGLSAEAMQKEVRQSKVVLEAGLKASVPFFCYPAGDYNEVVRQEVIESGFKAACTVKPGANFQKEDLFALKRTEISAFDSLWDFEKKLAGAFDGLHEALQWWQAVAIPKHQCANALPVESAGHTANSE